MLIGAMWRMKSSKGNVWAEKSREQGHDCRHICGRGETEPGEFTGIISHMTDHKILRPRCARCSPGDKGLLPDNVRVTPDPALRGEHALSTEACSMEKGEPRRSPRDQGSDSQGHHFTPRAVQIQRHGAFTRHQILRLPHGCGAFERLK